MENRPELNMPVTLAKLKENIFLGNFAIVRTRATTYNGGKRCEGKEP
jgi:hypothetical protein